MSTVIEIQEAIQKLSPMEKSALSIWLDSQEAPGLSESEEATLLLRLDEAARQLDAGGGVSLEKLPGLVDKWATR